ncbi:hypothetical protein JKP88DRAFT_263559 [Tribonema minus]|uniref:Polymorphic outer membrane protein n=1 Tax=Tribonema minus TaxID=303371 RepID=A0A835YUM0_9STRA|nr:hypothetical protein JKP88DRAFT_263559 [Tribonema minus]
MIVRWGSGGRSIVGFLLLSCMLPIVRSEPCNPRPTKIAVRTTAKCGVLAGLVACEGGNVHALWDGRVVPPATIVIGNGTSLTITPAREQSFADTTSVNLDSVDYESIIDGAAAQRIFQVLDGGMLSLTGVRVQGGSGVYDTDSDYGGAIFGQEGSTITLRDAHFTFNNASTAGGALYTAGVLQITNVAFSDNWSPNGGGVYVGINGNSTMTDVSFLRNAATDGAGLYLYQDAVASISGAVIIANIAPERGAGIYNEGSLDLANFTCTSNSGGHIYPDVKGEGGCVYFAGSSQPSTLTDGYCGGNDSGFSGGCFLIKAEAKATLVSVECVDNHAHRGAGVYSDGDLHLIDCYFSNNTGVYGGGAIHVASHGLTMDGGGVRNSYTENGFGSAIQANGGDFEILNLTNVRFQYNKVHFGGTVFSELSTTMTGVTFEDNYASTHWSGQSLMSPGLYQINGRLNVQNSIFRRNDGPSGGTLVISTQYDATLTDVIFEGNNASVGSGAGLYLRQGTVVLERCAFTGNNATVKGGAIYSEPSVFLTVTNSSFLGNRAFSGGAVELAGEASSSAVFTSVSFAGNIASGSGGALMLGPNMSGGLMNCTFADNKATYGGALFVQAALKDVPLLALQSCSFTGNMADSAGGAMLHQGDIVTLTANDTVFVGNSALCCHAGSTQLLTDSVRDAIDGCQDMDAGYGTTRQARASVLAYFKLLQWHCTVHAHVHLLVVAPCRLHWQCCLAGDFIKDDQCVYCDPQLFDCSQIGVSAKALPLRPGLWRENLTQANVRQCWRAEACHGGSATDSPDDYCAEGYSGPYCAVCAADHTRTFGNKCVACDSGQAAAAISVFVILICAAAVGISYIAITSLRLDALIEVMDSATEDQTGLLASVAAALGLALSHLRIPIVVVQVLTQFASVTGAPFPQLYRGFLRWLNLFSLDLSLFLSAGCYVRTDFYDRLLFVTIAPLVCVAALGAFHLFVCRRHQRRTGGLDGGGGGGGGGASVSGGTSSSRSLAQWRSARARERLDDIVSRHATLLLAFTFLIFSFASTTVFQTFACDCLDGTGECYLRADYALSCGTARHRAYVIYASFMVLVYPVGIPALYAYMLRRHRKGIARHEDGGVVAASLKPTKFLWTPYKKTVYFWELIECARRLLLSGFLVFIFPGTPAQSAVACTLALITIVVYGELAPHKDSTDHRVYVLGSIIIFFSMFSALLVQGDYVAQDDRSAQVISVLLIALSVLLLAACALQIAVVVGGVVRSTRGKLGAHGTFCRRMCGKWCFDRATDADVNDGSPTSVAVVTPRQTTDSEKGLPGGTPRETSPLG